MCPVVERPQRPGQPARHGAPSTAPSRPATAWTTTATARSTRACRTNACGGACGCAVPTENCDGLDNNCDGNIDEGFMRGRRLHDNGLHGRLPAAAASWPATPTARAPFCDAPVVTPVDRRSATTSTTTATARSTTGTLPGVGVACGTASAPAWRASPRASTASSSAARRGMPHDRDLQRPGRRLRRRRRQRQLPQTRHRLPVPRPRRRRRSASAPARPASLVCRGTRGFVCEGCVLPERRDLRRQGQRLRRHGRHERRSARRASAARRARCALDVPAGRVPLPGRLQVRRTTSACPQRCAGVTCPTDQRCDEATGTCVDVCAGVVCTAPHDLPARAAASTATRSGCDGRARCAYAGRCQVDKCAGVTCGGEPVLRRRQVRRPVHARTSAPAGQRCVAGACIADKLRAHVGCGDGQFCDPATGKCTTDTCQVTAVRRRASAASRRPARARPTPAA